MSMSKTRKNLQDKLRRKFKWSTNTDYGRGFVLEKLNASESKVPRSDDKYVTDIYFNMSDFATRKSLSGDKNVREIRLHFNKYIEHQGQHKLETCLGAMISFEELELIYNIAKAAREEIKEELYGTVGKKRN